jgi:protein TonB
LNFRHNNKEITMHFTHMNNGGGTKVTKIAIVAVFHVVLALLLIKSMNIRTLTMPKLPSEVVVFVPDPTPPIPPPDPPTPMPQVAPPQIVAPPIEIEVRQTPPPDSVTAQVSADPAPQQPTPQAQAQAAPPTAASNPGAMRTAVLADASACVAPPYPARAARNGESGTVTLALLVGTDGRVAGSRIQKSSGSTDLDKAAVAALSMCKFKPATNGGIAEQAWAQIAYVWNLEQ